MKSPKKSYIKLDSDESDADDENGENRHPKPSPSKKKPSILPCLTTSPHVVMSPRKDPPPPPSMRKLLPGSPRRMGQQELQRREQQQRQEQPRSEYEGDYNHSHNAKKGGEVTEESALPRDRTSAAVAVGRAEPETIVIADDATVHTYSGPREVVAVFNANREDGISLIRALAKKYDVVAIVRVMSSPTVQPLLDMPGVTVKVADYHDPVALSEAIDGVDRAFLCLPYWERFDQEVEEMQAKSVLQACVDAEVSHLIFSTFEDTRGLIDRGEKSQLVPDSKGQIHPKFKGMKEIQKMAKQVNVQLTHMLTSYLEQEGLAKKSLCLLVGQNGKLIVQPNMMG